LFVLFVCSIGASLAAFAAIVVFFFIPPVVQDGMAKMDAEFEGELLMALLYLLQPSHWPISHLILQNIYATMATTCPMSGSSTKGATTPKKQRENKGCLPHVCFLPLQCSHFEALFPSFFP